jgi:hypothetical protein
MNRTVGFLSFGFTIECVMALAIRVNYFVSFTVLGRSDAIKLTIICCSKQRYLLGINLRNDWSAFGVEEKQQILMEVQGIESFLSQLLQ